MSQAPRKPSRKTAIQRGDSASPSQAEFDEVLALIGAAKAKAVAAVNTILIELYWDINQKIAEEGWAQGTVEVLAETIRRRHPGRSGFSASNLWRMRQFFETCRGLPKLAALLRELSWSHNLTIMIRCRRDEEREFYLRLAARDRWPSLRQNCQHRWQNCSLANTGPTRQRGSCPLSCMDLRRPSLALRAGIAPVGSWVNQFLLVPWRHTSPTRQRGSAGQSSSVPSSPDCAR